MMPVNEALDRQAQFGMMEGGVVQFRITEEKTAPPIEKRNKIDKIL